MFTDEEVILIGIIPEEEMSGKLAEAVIIEVMTHALSLGPMANILKNILKERDQIHPKTGTVFLQDVKKAINTSYFINETP